MNKKSHIVFTKKMNIEVASRCRVGLLVGSVLPDILVHTYLMGHTWKASGAMILNKLEKLEQSDSLNIWTVLRLGMILHYIEDFFTMSHSRFFQGNLLEHIGYEMRLQRYIRAIFNRRYKLYDKDVENTQIYSMNDLKERMVSLQKEYEKEIKEAAGDEVLCFQTDLEYMNIAVQTVAGYLIPALNRKSILYCKIENGTLVRIFSGVSHLT